MPPGAVGQSVDVTEDTEIETTMIAFNGNPLSSEYDFPSGPFVHDGITYDSYEEYCETNDCLNIVQYPLNGTLDVNNITITLDPDNSNFVIMSGGYSPNSNYGDDVGILEYFREECIGHSAIAGRNITTSAKPILSIEKDIKKR